MPAAVAEAEPVKAEIGSEFPSLSPEERNAKGQFTHAYRGGPGRSKGSVSYEKALTSAAPKLARAYVKHALKGNATLLVDSRKVFVPVDEDGRSASTDRIVVFIGDGSLPRQHDRVIETLSTHPSLTEAVL